MINTNFLIFRRPYTISWQYALGFSILAFAVSCRLDASNPEARSNNTLTKQQIDDVLRTFRSNQKDSLKYQAALFLINTLPEKYHYESATLNNFYSYIDSIGQLNPKVSLNRFQSLLRDFYRRNGTLIGTMEKVDDINSISKDLFVSNINSAFDAWQQSEWRDSVPFENFCEYILPYKINNEHVEVFRTKIKKAIPVQLDGKDMISAANAILAYTSKKGMYLTEFPQSMPDFPLSVLLNLPGGTCTESSDLSLYIMRAFGIPVAQDFILQWPHRSGHHWWSSLIVNKDSCIDFEGINSEKVGGHVLHETGNRLGKVYRKTFTKQAKSLALIHGDEDIPDAFKDPYFKDVTSNYFHGSRITVTVPSDVHRKFIYLCVFDNSKWVPIAWAQLKGQNAIFENVDRNVVYVPTKFENGQCTAIAAPILIDSSGNSLTLKPSETKHESVKLKRKYPVLDWWDSRTLSMVGGRFQASDDSNFANAETVYTINEKPELVYHTISTSSNKAFRYWRYLPKDSSYGDIAEIALFNEKSNLLSGTPIGTTVIDSTHSVAAAFDHKPLTFFQGAFSVGNWVGIDLGQKSVVKTIRYLGRNDENFIDENDEYELYYWKNDSWVSLGVRKNPINSSLIYTNVPINALLLLRDHSKGKEERIFTYKNDSQFWW